MQLRLIRVAVVLGVISILLAGRTRASGPDADAATSDSIPDGVGVLLMAHGGSEMWNGVIEATVAPLRDRYPIEIAFGMAQASTIRAALGRLENQGVSQIAVVRMFIASESFLPATEVIFGLRPPPEAPDTRRKHGEHDEHAADMHRDEHATQDSRPAPGHVMAPSEPVSLPGRVKLSGHGVAESALVDRILADRVRALSEQPSDEAVLILAHGPGDDAENGRWLAAMNERARAVRALGPFAAVQCMTLREDWLDTRAESESRIRAFVSEHARVGVRVIVIPFRIAGFGPYRDVLRGLDYTADEVGFCPHSLMTQWIDETARSLAAEFAHASASR